MHTAYNGILPNISLGLEAPTLFKDNKTSSSPEAIPHFMVGSLLPDTASSSLTAFSALPFYRHTTQEERRRIYRSSYNQMQKSSKCASNFRTKILVNKMHYFITLKVSKIIDKS
jgi:riboflavin transporter FmnP